MLNIEKNLKVKVLVLGDSGVGKSSFTHLLCHSQSSKNPGYTIGCSVEIKLHDYKQGTAEERTFCIEIWDIGASKSHTSSRSIFYNNVNGIILVHDLTNLKSLQNLSKWQNDVLSCESSGGLSSIKIGASGNNCNNLSIFEHRTTLRLFKIYVKPPREPQESQRYLSSGLGTITIQRKKRKQRRLTSISAITTLQELHSIYDEMAIPIVMVGTKYDLVPDSKRANVVTRSKYKADEVGCSEIHLDNVEPKYIAAGSGNAVQLSRFFDKVVEHSLNRRTTTTSGPSPLIGAAPRRQSVRNFGSKND